MIPGDRKRKLTWAAHSRIPLLQVITLTGKGRADKKPQPELTARFSVGFFHCFYGILPSQTCRRETGVVCDSSALNSFASALPQGFGNLVSFTFSPPYSFHNSTISFGKTSGKAAEGAGFILSHNYLQEASGAGVKSGSPLMFNEVFQPKCIHVLRIRKREEESSGAIQRNGSEMFV